MQVNVKELKVLVGIPSNGLWTADFGMSMLNMNTYFMSKKVDGYTAQSLAPNHIKGSILLRSRHRMVKTALMMNCSHVLFIDTDQTFPRDLIHRLLAHKVGVVAANIATKQLPAQPTARYAPRKAEDPGYGQPCYTDDKKGIERVWRVGTGVMLIDTNVFRKTGVNIFAIPYNSDIDDYGGEDWSMCEAFDNVNEPIWVDHDLSRLIGHVGSFTFTHDYIGEIRQK